MKKCELQNQSFIKTLTQLWFLNQSFIKFLKKLWFLNQSFIKILTKLWFLNQSFVKTLTKLWFFNQSFDKTLTKLWLNNQSFVETLIQKSKFYKSLINFNLEIKVLTKLWFNFLNQSFDKTLIIESKFFQSFDKTLIFFMFIFLKCCPKQFFWTKTISVAFFPHLALHFFIFHLLQPVFTELSSQPRSFFHNLELKLHLVEILCFQLPLPFELLLHRSSSLASSASESEAGASGISLGGFEWNHQVFLKKTWQNNVMVWKLERKKWSLKFLKIVETNVMVGNLERRKIKLVNERQDTAWSSAALFCFSSSILSFSLCRFAAILSFSACFIFSISSFCSCCFLSILSLSSCWLFSILSNSSCFSLSKASSFSECSFIIAAFCSSDSLVTSAILWFATLCASSVTCCRMYSAFSISCFGKAGIATVGGSGTSFGSLHGAVGSPSSPLSAFLLLLLSLPSPPWWSPLWRWLLLDFSLGANDASRRCLRWNRNGRKSKPETTRDKKKGKKYSNWKLAIRK